MDSKRVKTKSGKEVYIVVLGDDESPDDANEGLCIACGEFNSGVEPDARQYQCESCDEKKVYGIEELFLMGYGRIENES